MASETHEIRLIARDRTTQVLEQIGRQARDTARTTERSFEQVERSARETTRGMQRLRDASSDLGVGLAALGGAFTLAARSSVENQRQNALLTRQYGEQADSLRALSEVIQQTTQFSNDQALQAINTFGTLRRNYGLTTDEIVQLTRVTVDLAAATGFSLDDAATRVAAAIRGEAEAAEVLGLTLNQQAIDHQNLTLTMSNEEAGHFRLNALLDQAAFAQGAAAERVETHAGQVRQLSNRVQDVAQDVAAWTGVTGEAVAVASDFTLQLGLMGVGVAKLGGGLRTVSGAAGIAGLAAALGPVGLVLAVGAAGLAIAELTGIIDLFGDSADTGTTEAVEFAGALNRLAAAGDPRALRLDVIKADFTEIADIALTGVERIAEIEARLPALLGGAVFTEIPREQAASIAVLGNELANLNVQLGDTGEVADELRETDAALAELATQANAPGFGRAVTNIELLIAAWQRGDLTIIELLDGIQATVAFLPEYNRQTIAAKDNTQRLGDAAVGAAGDVDALGAATEHTTQGIGILFTGTKALSDRLKDYADGGERAARANERNRDTLVELAQAQIDATKAPPSGIVTGIQRLLAGMPTALPTLTADTSTITAMTVELTEQQVAYLNLTSGILTANEAQAAFKVTQDGLLAAQAPFNQQLSEYTSQLNALQAAEDLLNQRRAEGIALSPQEEEFLARVDAAQARLTGGVEDATLARGELALQYAENIRVGDQLNDTISGQTDITGQLIELVRLLILSLDGIPEDVKTQVRLLGADDAEAQTARLNDQLDRIDGRFATATVTVQQQVLGASFAGLPIGGLFAHGGLLPAAHGRLLPHEGLAGEFGPELVSGRMVTPHAATTRALAGREPAREVHLHVHGNVYGVSDLARTMTRVSRAMDISGARP